MSGIKSPPERGVTLIDRKRLAMESPIRNAILPTTAVVPFSQHLGTPAQCVVKVGERVREGMLIGKPQGIISAAVHSPIPGVVTAIREVVTAQGSRSQAAIISLEGEFERLRRNRPTARSDRSEAEILSLLEEMGVVGLGGAGFPTHVKLRAPKGVSIEHLLVNGVECEPYLTGDFRLMVERPREIVEGIRMAAKLLKPRAIVVGIQEPYAEAVEAMRAACRESGLPVEVVALPARYPLGDERQLVKALTGREIGAGLLPLTEGVAVVSVGTLVAIYEAVALEKPLFERVVTVSGGAVREPANLKVRIGTPIGALLAECGGLAETPERVVVGGPFTGSAVYDLGTPVTKSTTAVLGLSAGEVRAARRTSCISCGRCASVCPSGLDPARLFKLVERDLHADAGREGLLSCSECGCCSYVCPAHLPLVETLRVGKRRGRVSGVA